MRELTIMVYIESMARVVSSAGKVRRLNYVSGGLRMLKGNLNMDINLTSVSIPLQGITGDGRYELQPHRGAGGYGILNVPLILRRVLKY